MVYLSQAKETEVLGALHLRWAERQAREQKDTFLMFLYYLSKVMSDFKPDTLTSRPLNYVCQLVT